MLKCIGWLAGEHVESPVGREPITQFRTVPRNGTNHLVESRRSMENVCDEIKRIDICHYTCRGAPASGHWPRRPERSVKLWLPERISSMDTIVKDVSTFPAPVTACGAPRGDLQGPDQA